MSLVPFLPVDTKFTLAQQCALALLWLCPIQAQPTTTVWNPAATSDHKAFLNEASSALPEPDEIYLAHPSFRTPDTNGYYTTEVVRGRLVWVADDKLYFNVPDGAFPTGQQVHVRIEYLDVDRGYLQVQYDSNYGETNNDRRRQSEIHTRSSRVNSGAFAYSYHLFENPRFANRQNGGNDFRILLADNNGVPFRVASVSLSATPFSDGSIQNALTRPWLQSYSGPVKDFTDPQTLAGKVMTGYQGWFATPNDLIDRGWRHWGRSPGADPTPTNITIDMWPWINEYRVDQIYPAGGMDLKDGRPAYLFSSGDPDTVQRHFRWMRTHGIDGAYLQRFVSRSSSGYYGASEFVLDNVRKAASKEGRVWAIEYDISSMTNDSNPFEVITNDWTWLVDEVGILQDPRYVQEDGKPVLFIWGFSVPGREGVSLAEADAIIDWFANKNLYLIAGVHSSWEANTDWHTHYQKYDQLLGWMEPSGSNLVRQKELLESWGMKILPHAWPGFSWHNLQQFEPDTQFTPRDEGDFYWTRLYNAVSCGADQIFLGMFDEYDEGTAIMPMSDNHPLPHTAWGKYIDNEGRDPFWYLRLSGAASEMLNGFRPLSASAPVESEVSPSAYGGEGTTVYLGASDVEVGLVHKQPADGITRGTFIGLHDCRINEVDGYFYFDIDDAYCFSKAEGQVATIEIEFYDDYPDTEFLLQYDGLGGIHTQHPAGIDSPDTGNWKIIRWNISNGFFGNRQSGGSDFRIAISPGKVAVIRRVSVFLPEEEDGERVLDLLQLDIAKSHLSWPIVSDAVGLRLFESENLMEDGWQEVTGPFNFENGEIEYQVPASNEPNFYRLERPAKQ